MKTLTLYGYKHTIPTSAIAYVYATPSEPAKWLFTVEEVEEFSNRDRMIVLIPDDLLTQRTESV